MCGPPVRNHDDWILKAPTIQDATQLELREVDSSGSLKSGEKPLAELRKRKLIVQKYELISSFPHERSLIGQA